MNRFVWLVTLILIGSVIRWTTTFTAATLADRSSAATADRYLVKFDPGTSRSAKLAAIKPLGGDIVDSIPQLGLDVVRFSQVTNNTALQNASTLLETIEQKEAVAYVAPEEWFSVIDDQIATSQIFLPLTAANSDLAPAPVAQTPIGPNDPEFSRQYGLTKIQAVDGWHITSGSPTVTIAIIDTGVQLDHPDLQANLTDGYDFVDGDALPDDQHGHGTHVAGIAAADTDNGLGVAGTCSKCHIMPIRVLGATGSGSITNVIKGILYAADHGAQVINLSLANQDPMAQTTLRPLEDAINYAWNKGAFITCAAGNNATSDTNSAYPAAYDHCLAVGATTAMDERAAFSNYGSWVELAAPGFNIYSTKMGSTYGSMSGTSQAAPYVAGVAGLLASEGLTNVEIEARIKQTADHIAGTGTEWQAGRLNMWRALIGQ